MVMHIMYYRMGRKRMEMMESLDVNIVKTETGCMGELPRLGLWTESFTCNDDVITDLEKQIGELKHIFGNVPDEKLTRAGRYYKKLVNEVTADFYYARYKTSFGWLQVKKKVDKR